jgi:HK97 family phage prohead protease
MRQAHTKEAESKLKKRTKSNQFTRDIGISSLRAMEGEGNERKFIISFSSEEPYDRWFGSEILDHSEGCVDLTRLSEIGCVLFNHKRDSVIGKINRVWIEESRGCAEIEFDTDEESEKIYQKVKSGTLKGVSVGYRVDAWEEVMPNKKSADGRFSGPADIARKWTPFEVSIVSVPADPTVGVGRDMEDIACIEDREKPEKVTSGRSLSFFEWQLQINKNKSFTGGKI